jgi:hypothetical protein
MRTCSGRQSIFRPGRSVFFSPDREDREARPQDQRGGREARCQRQHLGGVPTRDGQRRGIGGVVGLPHPEFQPCHVGQVGQVGHGLEPGEEAGEFRAPELQARIARGVGAQENAGHRPEELIAEEVGDHREPGGQRIGQAGGHVVAVDVETAAGGAAFRIGQAGGRRHLGVQKCRPETGLIGHRITPPPVRGSRRRVRPRRGASASRARRCPIR